MTGGEVDTDVRGAKEAEDCVPEFLGLYHSSNRSLDLLPIFQ